MAVDKISGVQHYTGLSTDTKPTTKVHPGSTFFETDTGLRYEYGSGGWSVEASSLAGGDVSIVNSSNIPLPADTGGDDHIFTGEVVDITDVAMMTLCSFSDVASAVDGLVVEQSTDGENFDHFDRYSIPADNGKVFTPNKAAQFARLVYTNGTQAQTVFRLGLILNYVYGKPSSHRIDEDIVGQDDAELVISVIKVPTNDPTTLKNVDVQNPFPTDGDSAYAKDMNLANSTIGTFSGNLLESIFNNYDNEIIDVSVTNPKTYTVRFRRPISTTQIGFGSLTGDFSNVKVDLKDLAGTVRGGFDNSSDNTKFTSAVFPLPPITFIEMVVEFHTADPVKISGMFIPKDLTAVARIQGLKPDGTVVDFEATTAGNFKVSLEEFDETFNTNPLPVVQTDPTGRKAELDNLFKVPITIDVQHHEIHEGDSFSATHNATLANTGTISLSFKTPNTTKQPHFTFLGRSSGEAHICLNEGVSVTPGTGNQHPAYNRKRDSVNETDLLEDTAGGGFVAGNIAEGATVAGGACIYEEHFGAGQTRGGATAGRNEFLLAPDTEYEVLLTSEAAANDCELILDYYEHTGE